MRERAEIAGDIREAFASLNELFVEAQGAGLDVNFTWKVHEPPKGRGRAKGPRLPRRLEIDNVSITAPI